MAETHPDYNKGKDGKRSPENGYNPDNLIHRCYGAISIDGQEYRVKLTLKETSGNRKSKIQKIKVLDEETPNTSNGVGTLNSELEGYPLAKVINNVGKSYKKDKKLLEQSKIADESTDLYRDPDEVGDILNDQSLGLQERITAVAPTNRC
ncbi:MAG: hypothetical protein MR980_05590 [Bacteroidales bacterium]|nr:hypothetical protein [Bacteroidales bacterium]